MMRRRQPRRHDVEHRTDENSDNVLQLQSVVVTQFG